MKALVVAPSWIGDTIMAQAGCAVRRFGLPKHQSIAACLNWISP